MPLLLHLGFGPSLLRLAGPVQGVVLRTKLLGTAWIAVFKLAQELPAVPRLRANSVACTQHISSDFVQTLRSLLRWRRKGDHTRPELTWRPDSPSTHLAAHYTGRVWEIVES